VLYFCSIINNKSEDRCYTIESQTKMSTQSNNTAAKTIVAFHIGRGGQFFNAGFLSFEGEKKISDYTDDLFLNEDQEWTDGSGHEVGLSLEQSKTGTGLIDRDGDYDTTYAHCIEDCSEDELELIYKSSPELVLSYLKTNTDAQVIDVLEAFGKINDFLFEIMTDGEELEYYGIEECTEDEYYTKWDADHTHVRIVNGKYYFIQ